jgi:ABC-type nickel/cobalt efflux system permease component RcnA
MKVLTWIAWISAAVAAIIILLACISLLTGKGILGFNHAVNFFHAANSFLLLSIALFIVTKKCECKNDK